MPPTTTSTAASIDTNDASEELAEDNAQEVEDPDDHFYELIQQKNQQHQNPEHLNDAESEEAAVESPQADDLDNTLKRRHHQVNHLPDPEEHLEEEGRAALDPVLKHLTVPGRPEHIPDIASLFSSAPSRDRVVASIVSSVPSRDRSVAKAVDDVFAGLQTHEVRSSVRQQNSVQTSRELDLDAEQPEVVQPTIGPYDSKDNGPDMLGDQPVKDPPGAAGLDDDSSTVLPETETSYKYNIKVRSNGKVLDPPTA